MEDKLCDTTLMESTASKIQQLQKAFAELESHRSMTLNFKWQQLEEHFHGLQKSLKRRFTVLESQEKEFDAKISESKEVLEKRQAAVIAKEQASLERLQEKRDVAVSVILTAIQKQKNPFSLDLAANNIENQVEAHVVNQNKSDYLVGGSNMNVTRNVENINVQVKAYPELVKLCREMNSEGLQKFISDNRKDLTTLREEIPTALCTAPDPAFLVLNSLNGFYGPGIENTDSKKDSNLLGLRRTCIMLMECLSSSLINRDGYSPGYGISEIAKQRAKSIAEIWKPRLADMYADACSGNSLEAHAFLQLLATFGISSDFDQESLCKLIPMVSRRRQTAELCRHLGLTEKMPGVIAVLIKNSRQIDAVNLAFAFELTKNFSPITLLKSYLSEAKKAPSAPKCGSTLPSSSSQVDGNEKELTALKATIKCIEDHKLEAQFPIEPLQKQILEIEKAKTEKKHATEVSKPQSKRPRASSISHAPRVPNATADKNFHGRMADRYPQHIFGRPYVPPYMGTPAYNFPPNHGNFLGNAYHYQTAYLH